MVPLLCEEGRSAQALVLAGMRMSDAHHGARWLPPSAGRHASKFISDHPEWCNTWEDGIELDWTRHGRHFPSGRQKEHAPILTETA